MDINHSPVRFIVDPQAEISPDVRKEDKLVGWGEALYANSMRLVCAGVLQSLGSLEKAASVLWWCGYRVPPSYFPDGHEAENYLPADEEPLQFWVEAEAERIEQTTKSIGFYMAARGQLLEEDT